MIMAMQLEDQHLNVVQTASGSLVIPVEQTQTNSSETSKAVQQQWSWSREIRKRLMATMIVLAVYVLSIGPMFWSWYESKYLGGSPLVAAIYEPLLWTTEYPLIRHILNAYIDWWIL